MPPAAGALGNSKRRKEFTRSGSSGDKRDHKSSVVDTNTASAPRDKNSFVQRSRSGSGDHTVKRSGSGNGDNATLLLSSSPPIDRCIQQRYTTSSSPCLSPNMKRQNKIFLSSAKIRSPKFNKEEDHRGVMSTDEKWV